MIITVSMNPAIDKTVEIEAFAAGRAESDSESGV